MPRPASSQLIALLPGCASESTLDIRLRGETDPFHFATDELLIGGITYLPLLLDGANGEEGVGELKETATQSTNRVSVKISNVLSGWGAKVANALRPLELADCVIKTLYFDEKTYNAANPLTYRHEYFFSGKSVGAEANEEYVSFEVIPKTTASGLCIANRALSVYNDYGFPGLPVQSSPGSPTNPGGGIGTGEIEPVPGGSNGGGGCFIAGTRIFTPRGEQPIEDIKKGWKVYSYNSQTLEIEIDTVVETFRHTVTEYFEIDFEGGNNTVSVTAEHPFLSESGEFIAAGNLALGQRVWCYASGFWQKTMVCSFKIRTGVFDVFNITVSKNKTYFANRFAVHNKESYENLPI